MTRIGSAAHWMKDHLFPVKPRPIEHEPALAAEVEARRRAEVTATALRHQTDRLVIELRALERSLRAGAREGD